MSGSQGSNDLALSRADHDIFFPVDNITQGVGASTWDDGESIWDGGDSVWDSKSNSTIVRHAILAIDGADKVAQQIKITLLAFLGEWFLDVTFGVPYLEDILVKSPRLATIETILRSHINAVPHVLRLETFVMDWDRARRSLSVSFVAQTDYGRIEDSVKLDTSSHV